MQHRLLLYVLQAWLWAIPVTAWTSYDVSLRRSPRNGRQISRTLSSLSEEETNDSTTAGSPFIRRYDRFRVDLDRVERIVPENVMEMDSDQVSDSPVAAVSQFFQKASRAIQPRRNWNPDQIQREAAKKFPSIPSDNIQVLSSHNPLAKPSGSYDFPTCWLMTQMFEATESVSTTTPKTTSNDSDQYLIIITDPLMTPVVMNYVNILEWILNLSTPDDETTSPRFLKSVEFTTLSVGQQTAVPVIRMQTNTPPTPKESTQRSKTSADFADTIINNRTRSWVQRLLVQRGICPFTKHPDKSGQGLKAQRVPVGRIAYHASNTHSLIPLLTETWKAMYEMVLAGEEGISSILLAAPKFDADFSFWAGPVFASLEASVVAAQAEEWLGVVCFHPSYQVNDGSSWPGFGHLHSVPRLEQWVNDKCTEAQEQQVALASPRPSRQRAQSKLNTDFLATLSTEEIAAGGAWQRRTPHATINVLRANQLAKAETVRDSSTLYPRNIQVLMELGNEQLQADLEREQELP